MLSSTLSIARYCIAELALFRYVSFLFPIFLYDGINTSITTYTKKIKKTAKRIFFQQTLPVSRG